MRRDLVFAVIVAALVGAGVFAHGTVHPKVVTDLDQVIVSARALLSGQDAYSVTGPGRAFGYLWPQYYPATAFVPFLPVAHLPFRVAGAIFMALSVGWLAFAVLRSGTFRIPMFASGAFIWALVSRQWSPALVAASLTPALAGLLAAKPTTGLALLTGARSWRTVAKAAIGGTLLALVAFAFQPDWPLRWLESFRGGTHFVAPITRLPFGPLVLLALLRWRRPEARLLVALACVPQTNAVNDVLPLFLVAGTFGESILLAATTAIIAYAQAAALAARIWTVADLDLFAAYCATSATWLVLGAYLPCVVMVLRRPNVAPTTEGDPDPAGLARNIAPCA